MKKSSASSVLDTFQADYPLSKLKTDPNQPRTIFNSEAIAELAASLAAVGMINPIEITADGVIVTGERRYRAASSLGWETVPVKIIAPPDALSVHQLAENIHRQDLSPLEITKALLTLRKQGISVKEIGKMYGKTETWVYGYLRIARLPAHIQAAMERGELSGQDASALELVRDPEVLDFMFSVVHQIRHHALIPRVAELITSGVATKAEVTTFLKKNPTIEQLRAWVAQLLPRLSHQIRTGLAPGNRLMIAADAFALALAQTRREDVAPTQLARLFMSLSNVRSELEIATGSKFLPPTT